MSCGEISDFCKEFAQFMEFYRNLCHICSKFVWRKNDKYEVCSQVSPTTTPTTQRFYSATLKKSDEGVEQDCVVGEVRLLGGQPVDDRLVESRHQDVDASQGKDKDYAGENSHFIEKTFEFVLIQGGNIVATNVILKMNSSLVRSILSKIP